MVTKQSKQTFYIGGGHTEIIMDKENVEVGYDKATQEIIVSYPCVAVARIPLNVNITDATNDKKDQFEIEVCCEEQAEQVKERLHKTLGKNSKN